MHKRVPLDLKNVVDTKIVFFDKNILRKFRTGILLSLLVSRDFSMKEETHAIFSVP
jgi:hypothetical protein